VPAIRQDEHQAQRRTKQEQVIRRTIESGTAQQQAAPHVTTRQRPRPSTKQTVAIASLGLLTWGEMAQTKSTVARFPALQVFAERAGRCRAI